MNNTEIINENIECCNQIFTGQELKELLINDNCINDTKVIEIINRYEKRCISLDEAITEILVSYLECNN